jgi:hypothetical protein
VDSVRAALIAAAMRAASMSVSTVGRPIEGSVEGRAGTAALHGRSAVIKVFMA